VNFRIDGANVAFSVWNDPTQWWATARHAGVGLILHAYGVSADAVELKTVTDIEPYLLGSRAQISALRGDR